MGPIARFGLVGLMGLNPLVRDGWKVQFEFIMLDWVAYADDLSTQGAWLDWARGPAKLPSQRVQRVPTMTEMPPMMRRRVDRLGRLACQVAYWCQQTSGDAPLVFASRYGDADRSLSLLGDLIQQQALSPTGFALSVHNAIAALYSIARGDTRNVVVVAAGRASVTAALVEAVGLIADGESEVLVVCYESPLPDHYAHFHDESACEFAWAWRVAGPSREGDGVKVRVTVGFDASPSTDWDAWPEGLLALRQVLGQVSQSVSGQPAEVSRKQRPGVATWWNAHV